MKADLNDLAARVEALTGPDREIDAEIAATLRLGVNLPDWAIGWAGEWRPTIQGSVVQFQNDGSPGPHFVSAAYTASIDAAMTLVPENHAVDLTIWGPLWGGKHRARVLPLVRHGDRWLHRGSDPHFCVNAATPALALTAAALRSRVQGEG